MGASFDCRPVSQKKQKNCQKESWESRCPARHGHQHGFSALSRVLDLLTLSTFREYLSKYVTMHFPPTVFQYTGGHIQRDTSTVGNRKWHRQHSHIGTKHKALNTRHTTTLHPIIADTADNTAPPAMLAPVSAPRPPPRQTDPWSVSPASALDTTRGCRHCS